MSSSVLFGLPDAGRGAGTRMGGTVPYAAGIAASWSAVAAPSAVFFMTFIIPLFSRCEPCLRAHGRLCPRTPYARAREADAAFGGERRCGGRLDVQNPAYVSP